MTDLKVVWSRRIVYVALIVALLSEVVVSLNDGAPWLIWVVRLLPLLIFLPGMLANKLRSYIWLCFVCLLYFMVAVLRMFAQPENLVTIAGLVATVTLFTSAMMYVRWQAQLWKKDVSDD
jgi:uncharacterized membrane protein